MSSVPLCLLRDITKLVLKSYTLTEGKVIHSMYSGIEARQFQWLFDRRNLSIKYHFMIEK